MALLQRVTSVIRGCWLYLYDTAPVLPAVSLLLTVYPCSAVRPVLLHSLLQAQDAAVVLYIKSTAAEHQDAGVPALHRLALRWHSMPL